MAGTVGVAPGTTTLTLPSGETLEIADWIDDKIYSTVQLSNGQVSPVEAFAASRSQQISGGTRTITQVDTNIQRAGDAGLPMSWAMRVYSIEAEIVRVCRPQTGASMPVLPDGSGALSNAPTLQTLLNIDRITYLQFFYNQKSYTDGVMKDYPAGRGYSVFSTNANFELAQNGVPSPRDRNALVLPIPMQENLGYKLAMQPVGALLINQAASDASTNLTFADVKITLVGLIKRNVF